MDDGHRNLIAQQMMIVSRKTESVSYWTVVSGGVDLQRWEYCVCLHDHYHVYRGWRRNCCLDGLAVQIKYRLLIYVPRGAVVLILWNVIITIVYPSCGGHVGLSVLHIVGNNDAQEIRDGGLM